MRRLRDNRKITRFRSSATVGKIFPRASFIRLVRECLQDHDTGNDRYLLSVRAGAALQTAAESYLDGLFDDCGEIIKHTGGETLNCGVMQLVRRLHSRQRASSPPGDVPLSAEPGYVMIGPIKPESS